jgi:hypothetical protein
MRDIYRHGNYILQHTESIIDVDCLCEDGERSNDDALVNARSTLPQSVNCDQLIHPHTHIHTLFGDFLALPFLPSLSPTNQLEMSKNDDTSLGEDIQDRQHRLRGLSSRRANQYFSHIT